METSFTDITASGYSIRVLSTRNPGGVEVWFRIERAADVTTRSCDVRNDLARGGCPALNRW